jgi:hypothetical protein
MWTARKRHCSPRQECRTTQVRSQNKQPVGFIEIKSGLVEVIAHHVDHDKSGAKAYSEETHHVHTFVLSPLNELAAMTAMMAIVCKQTCEKNIGIETK